MVTFPLVEPTVRELDFYAFGGQLGPDGLKDVLEEIAARDSLVRRRVKGRRWGWYGCVFCDAVGW